MNQWYVTFGKWQTRSFVEPDVSKWEKGQEEELDKWIKTQVCLSTKHTHTMTMILYVCFLKHIYDDKCIFTLSSSQKRK
jgi:hypothetical protein